MPSFKFISCEFPELSAPAALPRQERISKTLKKKSKKAPLPSAGVVKSAVPLRGGGQKRIKGPLSSPKPAVVVEEPSRAKKTSRKPTHKALKEAVSIDRVTTTTAKVDDAALDPTKLKTITEFNTLNNISIAASNESTAHTPPVRRGRLITFNRKTRAKLFKIAEGKGPCGDRALLTGSPLGKEEMGRLKRPAAGKTGALVELTPAEKDAILGPSTLSDDDDTLRSQPDRGCRETCPDGICTEDCICRKDNVYCDEDECPCEPEDCTNHDPKPRFDFDRALVHWEEGESHLIAISTPSNSTIPSVDVSSVRQDSTQASTPVHQATFSDVHVTKRRRNVLRTSRSSPYGLPKEHPSKDIRDRRMRLSATPSSASPPGRRSSSPSADHVQPAALPAHGINLDRALFSQEFYENYLPEMITNQCLQCLNPKARNQQKWLTGGAVYFGLLKEVSAANMTGGKFAVLHPDLFAGWPTRNPAESDDDLARREPSREAIETSVYYRHNPEYLIMPLHHGDHWAISIYRVKESEVIVYDSLSPSKEKKELRLAKLHRMMRKLLGEAIADSINYRYALHLHSERQKDGVQCGIFAIVNGRRLTEGRKNLKNKRKSDEKVEFAQERKKLKLSLDAVRADLAAIGRANQAAQQVVQAPPPPVIIRAPTPPPPQAPPAAQQVPPPLRRSQRNNDATNRKIQACCAVLGTRTPKPFGARRRSR